MAIQIISLYSIPKQSKYYVHVTYWTWTPVSPGRSNAALKLTSPRSACSRPHHPTDSLCYSKGTASFGRSSCNSLPRASPELHEASTTHRRRRQSLDIICLCKLSSRRKAPQHCRKKLSCANASCRHLLPKKSWHVYNQDNVERVRRDEANAKAAEEAEEQRMQEVDAARRLAILRGETPPPIEDEDEAVAPEATGSRQPHALGTGRRPRKRQGEDDTDFELRIAKERGDTVSRAAAEARRTTSSAPIVDRRGHINLFGEHDKQRTHAEKNEEAEKETARTKRSYEDQYTMRFSNAGGHQAGLDAPWYSAAAAPAAAPVVMKNVWGRDDPHRKERDEKRIASSDPLAMMKHGAARVRELKQERGRFQEERERELRQMKREEGRRERRHRSRRHRSRSPRGEERRRLDDGRSSRRTEDEERSRHDCRDRSRSGERSRGERRYRHRSRSREVDRHRRHDEKRSK